jgi:nitroreductase
MDVFEAIRGRRSVRRFKSNAVGEELIEKLLTAACWAPSGGNIQPWKFIVVQDHNMLEMVRKISPGYFGETPLAILVCSDKTKAVADCAMATENLVLAAYASGLGTCIVKSFSHAAMKEVLEIPQGIEPELLIVVGYPETIPAPPRRIPLRENTYLNKFGENFQTSEG